MMVTELLPKRRRLKLRLSLEGIIVGVFTGITIATFRFLIDEADIYRPAYFEILKLEKSFSLWLLTVTMMVIIAFMLAKFIKFDGQIAGSGVPQIKGVLQDKMNITEPLRLILMKLFASVIAIGTGMSLGRAGLSVQFGACIGKIFDRLLGRHHIHNSYSSTIESKYLLTAGAGAGLAAVFNAPLAGVIFCVEELQKKLSSELLMVSITAAVSASAVVELVFGIRPVFETFTPTFKIDTLSPDFTFAFYVIILGIITGYLGSMFTKMLIFSLNAYDKLKLTHFKKFLIPLISIIPIGLILPEILGCGNLLVDDLLSRHFELSLLLILYISKFLFTMICFGTSAPGGIFLPLLVLGALSGDVFASIGVSNGLFSAGWTAMFIILAMAAYFAAVVKAPITGSVLIMELTGNFHHLLALIIISCIAFLVSDICGGKPVYSALLERSLKK